MGEQVAHGTVRGPPLAAVVEGPRLGIVLGDALARAKNSPVEPTGTLQMQPRRIIN